MAPSRQVIIWSVPSLAVILGLFWFRKRHFAKSDPGGKPVVKNLQEELAEALKIEVEAKRSRSPSTSVSSNKIIAKTAPIDIVPNGSNSQNSSLELTDEEIEIEIEKIIQKKSLEKSLDKEKIPISPNNSSTIDTTTEFENISTTIASQQEQASHITEDKATASCAEESQNSSTIEEKPIEKMEVLNISDSNSSYMLSVKTTNNTEGNSDVDEEKCIRHSTERDSANHSPLDPMLASPSMCHFSDNHSEGSNDSGKGCSEAASPPPVSLQNGFRMYQFLIPQSLVGLLIGRQGAFVTQVKSKTGASIYVKRHPESNKTKICVIEGTQSELNAALDMIRKKFPEKKFPHLSLEEISAENLQRLFPIIPEILAVPLVEVVNNETIMTCLVTAGHFFLQQPFHPTFPALHVLHRAMAKHYHTPGAPQLPTPITEGTICAAPTENNWYRAQVISTSQKTESSVVKLVDFGGYLTVDNDQLKQIHADFMNVPFQASEAMLAYVKPKEDEWSSEALQIMAGLTAGQLLLAQVAGYNEDGVPLVSLYLTLQSQEAILLNAELVERGLAEWDVTTES